MKAAAIHKYMRILHVEHNLHTYETFLKPPRNTLELSTGLEASRKSMHNSLAKRRADSDRWD